MVKKVINAKLYDTDASAAVATSTHGKGDTAIHETLHRKRTGEFFLYGEGGPSTRYAQPSGNGQWESGSNLFPMTEEAAKNWAKENCPSQYDSIFGEKQNMRSISLSLPVMIIDETKKRAEKEGVKLDQYVSNLLTQQVR